MRLRLCILWGTLVSLPAAHANPKQIVAPNLRVTVLRADGRSGAPRPMAADEVLAPRESPFLDIQVDRSSYIMAVLYAKSGTSEVLHPAPASHWLEGKTSLRLSIPRRAPTGVPEPELAVYVYAGAQPMSPLLAAVLHLPCSLLDEGRGDPIPENPPPPKPSPPDKSKGGDSDKPKPKSEEDKDREEPIRGGGSRNERCNRESGVSAPGVIRAVLLRSE